MRNESVMQFMLPALIVKILLITFLPFHVVGSDERDGADEIGWGSGSVGIPAQEQQQRHGYVANEVIVRLKQGVNRSIIDTIGSAHGVEIIEEIPQLNAYRLRVSPDFSVEGAMRAYDEHPDVEYATPNYVGQGLDVFPTDVYFLLQWHLNNVGQSGGTIDADIDAPEGWEITRGLDSIIVAVLDTGILFDHPEFAGRLLPGWDCVNDDSDPTADHPHGVYVAGILAANAANAFGVAGVDHVAMILPDKVLDEANQGATFDVAEGLVYAVDQGADVVNMSIGG